MITTVPIVFDSRWLGVHGIGRFAEELCKRLSVQKFAPNRHPLSAADPWLSGRALSQFIGHQYFSPGFNALFRCKIPYSLTIHDLIHLRYKSEATILKRTYYNGLLKYSIRDAKTVFTVSQFSKNDICNWANINPKRIFVLGNGVSEEFAPKGKLYVSNRPYILYVGNKKPHKNVEGLIRAFACSRVNREFDLLLTGEVDNNLQTVIIKVGMSQRIHFLGTVSAEVLPRVYRGARALVMPSYYEGFGLPVVEAMASGTMVICSNRTALPEVAGDAAVYFDPDSQESMVDALDAVFDDEIELNLTTAGYKRARLFSWDRVADKLTKRLYRD